MTRGNTPLFITIGLLVASLLGLGLLLQNNNSLTKTNKKQSEDITKLGRDNTSFRDRLDSLEQQSEKFQTELKGLRSQRERLIASRDSVVRLLAYSRTNERNAQGKAAQLQKRLKELETKLADVQKKYDEVLASSNSTDNELKSQLAAMRNERDALVRENQRLQAEIKKYESTADNRTALFATGLKASPGELSRGAFSPSTRSQNVDRVQVSFNLSRPVNANENLVIKIFDPSNKEVALKENYRNSLTGTNTKPKVITEFEKGKLGRRDGGVYSVRLYLTDVNKGLENQEIGLTTFEVK